MTRRNESDSQCHPGVREANKPFPEARHSVSGPFPLVPSKRFINGQAAPSASRAVVLGSNATELVAVL